MQEKNMPPKKEKPVDCTVAGVPLEPDTKPPPPVKDEGDKTKCPACGVVF